MLPQNQNQPSIWRASRRSISATFVWKNFQLLEHSVIIKSFTRANDLSVRKHKFGLNFRNWIIFLLSACRYCSKAFNNQKYLKYHESNHLNLRLFECPGCLKRFNTRQDMRIHQLRVHSDYKFQCNQCPNSSKSQVALSLHIRRRHATTKPFVCDNCDKTFPTKLTIKQHLKSVHMKSKFPCHGCDVKCLSRDELKRHLVKKHLNTFLTALLIDYGTELVCT